MPDDGVIAKRKWRVTGMDCAACGTKVRRAVERLEGVEAVDVAISSGQLIVHQASHVPPDVVETAVQRLGYGITPAPPEAGTSAASANHDTSPTSAHGNTHAGAHANEQLHDHAHLHAHVDPDTAWYRTSRGRLVIISGALLLVAWTIKFATAVTPATTYWIFAATCLIGLGPIAWRGLQALRAGVPFTIELLMTIAATGALIIGDAEEAALVVFLFAVGEVLEGVAATQARNSIRALGALVPDEAVVETGSELKVVPASAIDIGQVIVVRPGDRVATDGTVIEGVSGVDESPVTGESVPRTKRPGDEVFAGSINAEAVLRVRATTRAANNTIARIIRLVEEAESARAPTERFIDRFSRYYMPAIVIAAVLVAVVPPLLFGAPWYTWVYRALALLLIGCPCALVISVPAAMAASLSTGARHGLLMKGGAVIENVAAATRIAFDKTGTITKGLPVVVDVVPLFLDEAALIAMAAGIEQGSSHPLAEAIVNHAQERGIAPVAAAGHVVLPGEGVTANVAGEKVVVGSPRVARTEGVLDADIEDRIGALQSEGKTVVVIFRAGVALGLMALRDEPRADAVSGLAEVRALGLSSVLLTGDNARTAAAISDQLALEYRAELMPDDKARALREFAANGPVIMVGDGINDAPALAAATVGVAMGSGTGVALETADAALMRNRVGDVAAMVRLARATMANVRQNVTIALGLKAIFLVTTVFGVTGLWPAILADTGATVLVTMNALRLLAYDPASRDQQGRATTDH